MGKKLGRPEKTESTRRNCLMTLRLTADEIKAVDKAAKKSGEKRSDWTRKVLLSEINVIQ